MSDLVPIPQSPRMKNPHFITGPGRKCLCGLYDHGENDSRQITCQNIADAMECIFEHVHSLDGKQGALPEDVDMLNTVFESLKEECA